MSTSTVSTETWSNILAQVELQLDAAKKKRAASNRSQLQKLLWEMAQSWAVSVGVPRAALAKEVEPEERLRGQLELARQQAGALPGPLQPAFYALLSQIETASSLVRSTKTSAGEIHLKIGILARVADQAIEMLEQSSADSQTVVSVKSQYSAEMRRLLHELSSAQEAQAAKYDAMWGMLNVPLNTSLGRVDMMEVLLLQTILGVNLSGEVTLKSILLQLIESGKLMQLLRGFLRSRAGTTEEDETDTEEPDEKAEKPTEPSAPKE